MGFELIITLQRKNRYKHSTQKRDSLEIVRKLVKLLDSMKRLENNMENINAILSNYFLSLTYSVEKDN